SGPYRGGSARPGTATIQGSRRRTPGCLEAALARRRSKFQRGGPRVALSTHVSCNKSTEACQIGHSGPATTATKVVAADVNDDVGGTDAELSAIRCDGQGNTGSLFA